LRLFEDEVTLGKELNDFTEKNKKNLGLVSLDAPLLSNLDVSVNIALIKQYHENLSADKAQSLVLSYLTRYSLEHISNKRNPALTNRERFYVMLLRAVMVRDSIVVIDRPFTIIPDVQDDRFIYDALKVVDDSFKECHIFDYQWSKDRYKIIGL
jgi:ABC-type lipopolysaccharide export system ATPase subunit